MNPSAPDKRETQIIQIQDLSRGGAGVARLDSGEVVFVPHTAPGDRVRVQILEKKKNYSEGECVEILEPSPVRATPLCQHFTRCGGCSWQHLPYALQFETKKKGLLHALGRAQIRLDSGPEATSIPVDALPAPEAYGYRNRIQLHGNAATGQLGFYRPGSKSIIDLDHCPIADPRINAQIPRFRKEGMERFEAEFKLELDVSETGEVRAAWNRKNAAFGFRQVNDAQNAALQAWVSTHVKDAEVLFDLYGGDGNLSRGIASRFGRVECVDLFVPRNPESNLPKNFYFRRSDLAKWSAQPLSPEFRGKTTSIILDPPREGLNRLVSVLGKKFEGQPLQSLILVGCDGDAFVRDSGNLIKQGFRLERIGVLDLFPQTPHVESLALFSR